MWLLGCTRTRLIETFFTPVALCSSISRITQSGAGMGTALHPQCRLLYERCPVQSVEGVDIACWAAWLLKATFGNQSRRLSVRHHAASVQCSPRAQVLVGGFVRRSCIGLFRKKFLHLFMAELNR
jgi:hypothetical protein